MRKKSGFTLVELLVVISIIAMLLAILMPSLGRAREMGRSILCQTHSKSLVLSWTLYANSNNGRLCGSYTYNNNYMDWGHTWDWAWVPWRADVDMGVPYGGPYTMEQRKEGIRRGALYEYSKDLDVYHCPSDKTGNFRSYSIPDCLAGRAEERNPDNPDWKVLLRITQLKRPVEKYVFLEETDKRGFNMDSWEKDPDGVRWADLLTVWHNKTSNIAFADGHTENVRWHEDTVERFVHYPDETFRPTTAGAKEDLAYILKGWAE